MNSTNKCLIWETKLPDKKIPERIIGISRIYTIDNPRAGGKYDINKNDYDKIYKPGLYMNENEKIRLSGYIAKQNLEGKISNLSSIIKEVDFIETLPPIPSPKERAYLLLEGLVKQPEYFGQPFLLDSLIDPNDANTPSVYLFLHAVSYCNHMKPKEIKLLIEFLKESNFIRFKPFQENEHFSFQVTVQGFDKIEALSNTNYSKTVFIAMWFNKNMNNVRDAIEKSVENTGYDSVRIDNKEHLNKIDDEILLEIEKARFVICDLSSEKEKPRGSVYFEAGYAMGKNIPIIWTCDKNLEKERAFDIQNYNCLFWEKDNLGEFTTKLEHRIEQTIGRLET